MATGEKQRKRRIRETNIRHMYSGLCSGAKSTPASLLNSFMETLRQELQLREKVKGDGERSAGIRQRKRWKERQPQQGQQYPTNSLVPAPIRAFTANQKFRACVNENSLARDSFLAVGHLRWGSCVNLIDTGEGNIFFPIGDVQNIVKRFIGLKLPVHKNIWVQTEHLQEEEVTASLKKVAFDLLHCPKAEATGCLIDNMKAHLAVNSAPGCHPPEVIQQWD